jgi:hypothetical protein
MTYLIQKCTKPFTKEEMTATEGWILSLFSFDMSFTEISFSYLAHYLSQ